MAEPCEELYLACCPFCDYRRLFSSAWRLLVSYGAHLQGHEMALVWPGARSGDGKISDARIAAHAQRIQAAPFN